MIDRDGGSPPSGGVPTAPAGEHRASARHNRNGPDGVAPPRGPANPEEQLHVRVFRVSRRRKGTRRLPRV